jgi:hypothetical protein
MRSLICVFRRVAENVAASGHAHAAAVRSHLRLLAFIGRFRMPQQLRVQEVC